MPAIAIRNGHASHNEEKISPAKAQRRKGKLLKHTAALCVFSPLREKSLCVERGKLVVSAITPHHTSLQISTKS
jgi:hypothetical protein